jgi:hypothetical protein
MPFAAALTRKNGNRPVDPQEMAPSSVPVNKQHEPLDTRAGCEEAIMTYHPVPTIPVLVGPDKVSEVTRVTRGTKITGQAPQSALCLQHADLMAAANQVGKDTVTLKSAIDTFTNAAAAFKTARTALGTAVLTWDGSYDVFVTTTEKYAITPNDVASVGGKARGRTSNPLVPPISVDFTYDGKKDKLRIHVHRAPGMRDSVVEVSTDPITATSWKEQDGNGAVHVIDNPAPGTYWVQAASRTAKGKSPFTTPVSVIVK